MGITEEQLRQLSGRGDVYAGQDKVGAIGQVYLDDSTGKPSWVTVKTGLFGTSESFVPLHDAEFRGDDIVVTYREDQIKGAPRIDDAGSISPEEQDRLYQYYGLATDTRTTTGTTETTGTTDTTETTGTTGLAVTGASDVSGTFDADEQTSNRPAGGEAGLGRDTGVGGDTSLGGDAPALVVTPQAARAKAARLPAQ